MAKQSKKGFVDDKEVGGKNKKLFGSVQAVGHVSSVNHYRFTGSEKTSFDKTANGPAPRSKERHPFPIDHFPTDPTES